MKIHGREIPSEHTAFREAMSTEAWGVLPLTQIAGSLLLLRVLKPLSNLDNSEDSHVGPECSLSKLGSQSARKRGERKRKRNHRPSFFY